MCDAYTAVALLENEDKGPRRIDIDRELVQLVTIVGGVVIAVVALIVDGELGYAMGTGVLSLASGVMGYIFGQQKGGKNAEEVQEPRGG